MYNHYKKWVQPIVAIALFLLLAPIFIGPSITGHVTADIEEPVGFGCTNMWMPFLLVGIFALLIFYELYKQAKKKKINKSENPVILFVILLAFGIYTLFVGDCFITKLVSAFVVASCIFFMIVSILTYQRLYLRNVKKMEKHHEFFFQKLHDFIKDEKQDDGKQHKNIKRMKRKPKK